MKLLTRRRTVISLAIIAGLAALGVYGYYALKRAVKEFLEAKYVRATSGTVMGKEIIRFDEKNYTYIDPDDGFQFEAKPGDEQRRVYYQIDNFDGLDEPRRSRALEVERERLAKLGTRFTYNAEGWYEGVKVGDKVVVNYRVFSDGDIQVWTVDPMKN